MNTICKECPIRQIAADNMSEYREGWDNGLFLQAIQGLSAQMVRAVRGTATGLTEARIEEIRQSEVRSWLRSEGQSEADYLNAHPELAKAVHDCEVKIQLGECVLHSVRTNA